MKQEFITLPEEAARNLRIGEEVTVNQERYEVKTITITQNGADVELVQDDEAQRTINLETDGAAEQISGNTAVDVDVV